MSGYDDALAAIAAFFRDSTTENHQHAKRLAEPYAFDFGVDLLHERNAVEKLRQECAERNERYAELSVAIARRKKGPSPIVWIRACRYLHIAKVGRDVYHLEGEAIEFKLWAYYAGECGKAFVANVGSTEAASRKIRALRRSKR